MADVEIETAAGDHTGARCRSPFWPGSIGVGALPCFACDGRLRDVVAIAIDTEVTIPNLSLVFVLPVIIAAVGFGLGPSLCSAILGALAYNFFLTEPRYYAARRRPGEHLGNRTAFRRRMSSQVPLPRPLGAEALEAALRGRQATVLHGYCRDVLAAGNAQAIASTTTASALSALFQVPVVVILIDGGNGVSVERAGDIELQEAEFEAARSSLATGTVMRGRGLPDRCLALRLLASRDGGGPACCHWDSHSTPTNVLQRLIP